MRALRRESDRRSSKGHGEKNKTPREVATLAAAKSRRGGVKTMRDKNRTGLGTIF